MDATQQFGIIREPFGLLQIHAKIPILIQNQICAILHLENYRTMIRTWLTLAPHQITKEDS